MNPQPPEKAKGGRARDTPSARRGRAPGAGLRTGSFRGQRITSLEVSPRIPPFRPPRSPWATWSRITSKCNTLPKQLRPGSPMAVRSHDTVGPWPVTGVATGGQRSCASQHTIGLVHYQLRCDRHRLRGGYGQSKTRGARTVRDTKGLNVSTQASVATNSTTF